MDHELVEWAATLPSGMKMHGTNGKHVLKKALERRLPHEVLYRSKRGFAVPLAQWFRGPLRQRVRGTLLERGPLMDTGFFNPSTIRQIVEQHESGMRDHSTSIWTLMMFDAFLRVTMGQAATAAVSA